MNAKKRNRIYGVDVLKAICAFLVIIIHSSPHGKFWLWLRVVASIAVPVFFMISGYFCLDTEKRGGQTAQIAKIVRLSLLSGLLYTFIKFVMEYMNGSKLETVLKETIGKKQISDLIFFNVPFDGYHLWYLFALLYSLILFYGIKKIIPDTANVVLGCVTPVLFLVSLALGSYSLALFHREFPAEYTRNFLFVGVPFLATGYFIRLNAEKMEFLRSRIILQVVLVFVFTISLLLERKILSNLHLVTTRQHYTSTILLSIVLFVVFTNDFWEGKMRVLSMIGKEHSTLIYIIHPLIIKTFELIMEKLPQSINVLYFSLEPLIVFGTAILVSIAIKKVSHAKTQKVDL